VASRLRAKGIGSLQNGMVFCTIKSTNIGGKHVSPYLAKQSDKTLLLFPVWIFLNLLAFVVESQEILCKSCRIFLKKQQHYSCQF